jgi:hypothetical protein
MSVCIDESLVQAAVNTLHTMSPAHSPLVYTQLVEDLLADPDFPCGTNCRQYALHMLLTNTITQGFTHRVRVHGFLPSSFQHHRSATLEMIGHIARSGYIDLLSWSWLYYRFVRVDLGIGIPDFCAAASLHPRTLRRYQRRAIRHLTAQLRLDEYHARQRATAQR